MHMTCMPLSVANSCGWSDRQAGFSMLEALAAMMVLNLLALGVLFGQFQAMQAQRYALAMQSAVALAQDLWHRMLINPLGVMHYQWQGQAPAGPDCQNLACTDMQWAQADIAAWLKEVQTRMPGAKAHITTTALPVPQVRLQLSWPVAYAASTVDQTSSPDCPVHWRCWESTWRP